MQALSNSFMLTKLSAPAAEDDSEEGVEDEEDDADDVQVPSVT